ncbi:hypothetical protein GE09DRAFT_1227440 [Coniochaeta sp. 2T2.1]|nr:hypothetical protein GE09DRAFT_1227440 [Coniochaeta sp. 2T2.1]
MDNVTYYNPNDISGVLIIPHAVFSGIATIFVGLRWYTARVVARSPWTLDEYVCIVALLIPKIANYTMLFAESYDAHYGLGRPITEVTNTVLFLKGILAIEVTYGVACPLSKLAVLTMYYRIFSASPLLRYCVWVIAFGLVGWSIAVVGVSIFSCTPIHGFWDLSVRSKCIDSSKFYIGITVPNVIFDVMTVFLPIHEVWTLQMGRDKKLAITGVFLLGGSVILASLARLVLFSIFRPGAGETGNNISQTVVIPHSASAIETCLAIIGACLPPCAPLLRRVLGGVIPGRKRSIDDEPKNYNTLITIGKISNRTGGRQKGADEGFEGVEGDFVRLEDGDGSAHGSTDDLYVNTRNDGWDTKGGVHMKRDVGFATTQKRGSGDIPLREISAGARGH